MKTVLIFVRHGETEVNTEKKLHKDNDPNELNNVGKEQIQEAGEKIKSYKPDVIYSSKEKRALQSAEIISMICGVEFKIVDGLQERNWGDLSGSTWLEIQVVLDKMTFDERFNYIPPNGESWKKFDARLRSKLVEIVKNHKGRTVVIVTHGGAIRALIPYLLDVSKEESFKYDPNNASLSIFEHDGNKFFKKTVNDTSHLGK